MRHILFPGLKSEFCCWLFSWVILRPWRFRQCVSLKFRQTYTRIQRCNITKETVFFEFCPCFIHFLRAPVHTVFYCRLTAVYTFRLYHFPSLFWGLFSFYFFLPHSSHSPRLKGFHFLLSEFDLHKCFRFTFVFMLIGFSCEQSRMTLRITSLTNAL